MKRSIVILYGFYICLALAVYLNCIAIKLTITPVNEYNSYGTFELDFKTNSLDVTPINTSSSHNIDHASKNNTFDGSHDQNYNKSFHRPPRNKVVLIGPHDRYNFGDLLFEKIATKLLVERAGYLPNELLYGGIITKNMSNYGGPNVQNMKFISNLSKHEGPFDIVYLGGELMGCLYKKAIEMLPSESDKEQAKANQVSDCAYLFPKHKLVSKDPKKGPQSKNFAIANSIGGSPYGATGDCNVAIKTADYISRRDGTRGKTLYPDSAVMTKRLFGDYLSNVTNSPGVSSLLLKTGGCYIAVQHKEEGIEPTSLAHVMDQITNELDCTIVFFAAGTAPGHDSFKSYELIQKMMKMPSIVFREENIWSVIFTIAHARAVISTSLHVRIISFLYQKPRVTLCTKPKHKIFLKLWDHAPLQHCTDNDDVILFNIRHAMKIKANWTQIDEVEEKYLKNFDAWSSLLVKRENYTSYGIKRL